MKEKIYNFERARNSKDVINYSKIESELNDLEINLLTGEWIYEYEKLPKIVQNKIKQILDK